MKVETRIRSKIKRVRALMEEYEYTFAQYLELCDAIPLRDRENAMNAFYCAKDMIDDLAEEVDQADREEEIGIEY